MAVNPFLTCFQLMQLKSNSGCQCISTLINDLTALAVAIDVGSRYLDPTYKLLLLLGITRGLDPIVNQLPTTNSKDSLPQH